MAATVRVRTPEDEMADLREQILCANPLVFGDDGTIDHSLPLSRLVELLCERVHHLRELHHEAVKELTVAFHSGWKACEKHQAENAK